MQNNVSLFSTPPVDSALPLAHRAIAGGAFRAPRLFTHRLAALGLCSALLAVTPGMTQAGPEPANYRNAASAEETLGFFSGAIAGGLAGGPPGAIIGAAIGAFAGDGQHARTRVKSLQGDLLAAQLETEQLRAERESLADQYQVAMAELDRLRQARTQPAFLPGNDADVAFGNTALTVHFRSGSSQLEPQYQAQLKALAELVKALPNAAIDITGYADRNGNSERNLDLSRQRSTAVKRFFNQQGISDAALTTVAHGDSQPLHTSQSLETDFFDRRVIVRLRDTRESMLSQTPEGH